MMFLLKYSNFSENWDLLPWIQNILLPSKIKESTCEREGELKIKFEKERMRAIEIKMENFKKKKKKNWIEKKNWRRRKNSKEEGEEE
jgi:predicted phage tail protein